MGSSSLLISDVKHATYLIEMESELLRQYSNLQPLFWYHDKLSVISKT